MADLPASTTATTIKTHDGAWLRILQINDVYELDAFPSLATAIRTLQQPQPQQQNNDNYYDTIIRPDETVVLLAGDFLAPSVLSSFDHGASMMDCLMALGVTHVGIGNHEADVPIGALRQRIVESSSSSSSSKSSSASSIKWVNSNIHGLFRNDDDDDDNTDKDQIMDPTIPYDIIQIQQGRRQVALLGLCTHDPALYRPGAFGSGATIEPIVPATRRLLEELRNNNKNVVDLIIPMTHQGIREDREFAKTFANQFPIICGGHDHTPYDEVESGCRILKAGMDATNIIVIDIQWDNNDDDEHTAKPPTVTVKMHETSQFAPDPAMQQRVQNHQKILQELNQANLFLLSNWLPPTTDPHTPFSTRDNRTTHVSTGTTALCTMLRMGLRAQCGMINAGAVRGNRVYDDNDTNNKYFTWSDLKAEMPFPTAMTAVYLPGSVLQATLVLGRSHEKRGTGGFLHHCNNIVMTNDFSAIESIQGKPFDPDRKYLTAIPAQFFEGIDNHRPLLEYAARANQPELSPTILQESALPAKVVLVQVFSSLLWLQMGSFETIDCNNDGALTRDEIQRQVDSIYGRETGKLVLDNIMSVADLTGDGIISPLEMMVVKFAATDLLEHACSREELRVMRQVALDVLGQDASAQQVHDMISKVRETLDLSGDGVIRRGEVMKAVGSLQHCDILN